MAIWVVSMAVMTTLLIIWHYCLREVAVRMSVERNGTRARKPVFFAILIVAFPLFLMTISYFAMQQTHDAQSSFLP